MHTEDIFEWQKFGIVENKAIKWISNGFDLEDAIEWINYGFDLEAAIAFRKLDLTPLEAREKIIREVILRNY